MGLEVGSILDGKVTGITKFGAFVALPEGKSGLVHISEIANTYVSDVNEHLQIGQAVKVKVINITEDGKINLSIKRAIPGEPAPKRGFHQPRPSAPRPSAPKPSAPRASAPRAGAAPAREAADEPSENKEFEDRLKKFMQEANSRIADNKFYAEHKQRGRRR